MYLTFSDEFNFILTNSDNNTHTIVDDESFGVSVGPNIKTLTLLDPDNRLLVDTNFDGKVDLRAIRVPNKYAVVFSDKEDFGKSSVIEATGKGKRKISQDCCLRRSISLRIQYSPIRLAERNLRTVRLPLLFHENNL